MPAEPSMSELASLPALLARNATIFRGKTAYREKEFGIWQAWSWDEAQGEIDALALGLLTLGVERGDMVAIIGRNRPGALLGAHCDSESRGNSGAALSGCGG